MSEWRQVIGYPRYEVNECGDVRIVASGRLLQPWKTRHGRWQVKLTKEGVKKAFYTYVLVAHAFIGPKPFPGAVVAHRDDDRDNNHVSNLKWATHAENCADRLANGRTAIGLRNGAHTKPEMKPRGTACSQTHLTEDDIREIRLAASGSQKLAAQYGIAYSTLNKIRSRTTWRHIS